MKPGFFRTFAPIRVARSPLRRPHPCREMASIWFVRRMAHCSGSLMACASQAPVSGRGSDPGTVSQTVQKRPGEKARVVPIGEPDAHGVATDGIERNDSRVFKRLSRAGWGGRSVTSAFRARGLSAQVRGLQTRLFTRVERYGEDPPFVYHSDFVRPGRRGQSALSSR